jgi:carboxylesterase type B
MSKRFLFVALVLVAAAWSLTGKGAGSQCAGATVTTRAGAICGVVTSSGAAFLGIPYAESTARQNRWMPPVPKANWQGTLKTTAFSAACPQRDHPNLRQSEDCLSVNVWTPSAKPSGKLPVLVFIHGGAFQTGSSADPLPSDQKQAIYDGAFLSSSQRIVVVTLNYRLGALGFLAGVNGLKGNFGFMDQQLALEWVRDNITAFGGDGAKVTLSGESAGAMSVGLHLLSAPKSEKLFSAAIMQSNPLGLAYRTVDEAKRSGEYFSTAVGCFYNLQPLACLRQQTVSAILKAQGDAMLMLPMLEFGAPGVMSWSPVIDGSVITRSPIEALKTVGIQKPLVLGVNANEGDVFVGMATANPVDDLMYRAAMGKFFSADRMSELTARYPARGADNRAGLAQMITDYFFVCANRFVAASAAGISPVTPVASNPAPVLASSSTAAPVTAAPVTAAPVTAASTTNTPSISSAPSPVVSRAPVYAYRFNHASSALSLWPKLSICRGKACHSDELPFTFGNFGASKGINADDQAMKKRMTDYWGAFVRSNRPSAANAPQWMPYTKTSKVVFEFSKSAVSTKVPASTCDFWDSIGYSTGEAGSSSLTTPAMK